MPPHVCRCGGAGWDGCPPRRDIERARRLAADAELRVAVQERLSAASRGGGSPTFRELLAAAADVAQTRPRAALPASPDPVLNLHDRRRSSRATL